MCQKCLLICSSLKLFDQIKKKKKGISIRLDNKEAELFYARPTS